MAEEKTSRVESSDVILMFPTFVWKTQLEAKVYEAINRDILGALEEMTRSLSPPRPGSSWQSANQLQTLEAFRELISCVDATARTVLRFLRIACEDIEVTGCWINMNAQGAAHSAHSHPNNFLSGTYYVEAQDGADTIYFHDPRPQTGIIRPHVTELTAENTDQSAVPVRNGTLLMFPAWLQHSVPPNTSRHRRVSVSFNIMFPSYGKTMSTPLWGTGHETGS